MSICLILPTYNEKPNLAALVAAIFAQKIAGLSVIIVDDNSPDGTGQLADELAAADPRVAVLHRPQKQGLGPAYLAGFRVALQRHPELVAEMDADFSHRPADLPKLIKAAEQADLVIGSRYIEGGGVENWHWLRRLISRFGNSYARWMLRLPVRDLTAGFVVYRRTVLEQIDLSQVSSLGYNFQIEMKAKAVWRGFSWQEVPIIFCERQGSQSKFSPMIMLESFIRVAKLRLSKDYAPKN